ncbi:MAG TPA: aryl-sulfate sulfotransferase [Dehalococcoidia bacterium]|jgi:hypothetical protein|nr:aryl-sulfate sulfotransferase [Dehalococcoidia bacterium]
MGEVEQNTQRRTLKLGLTAHDPERTCPGFVLYAPMFGDGEMYLIDMQGNDVRTLQMPYPPGLWGYVLPNGNIFYGGKVKNDETWDRFPAWRLFKGGVMAEVDWDGNVVWEHGDINHHHDARRTESGGAIYLASEPMPEDLVRRVQGGVAGTGHDEMWADVIVEVDAAGNRVWEWHMQEHLDVDRHRLTFNDIRHEWSHANTVVPLDGDRVMVSMRNVSTVAIIDKATGEFEWEVGSPMISQQHDPSMLENGHVLVFDNGGYRPDVPLPFSRVIELDRSDSSIGWVYRDPSPLSFFSPYISGAQRLSNGNTLVTEGNSGRIFQVTPDRDVVWEYTNPHFHTQPAGQVVNWVFRTRHYDASEIPGLS